MAQESATKPYADYTWYTGDYGGSIIPESDFLRHAKWASYLIDQLTFGNITSDDDVIDCVKDATCAAAELAYNYYRSSIATEDGRGKKSETNDGYSISWDDTLNSAESLIAECRESILAYLQNTGLLSRHVRRYHPYG